MLERLDMGEVLSFFDRMSRIFKMDRICGNLELKNVCGVNDVSWVFLT